MKQNDKKERIISAFMELASSNSNVNDISVKMIAEKAGIGKGTVYEYFNSKEEIIKETVMNIIDTMFQLYLINDYEGLSFSESIKRFIDNCHSAATKVSEYSRYNSFTVRETFKHIDTKGFLHDKIMSLVKEVIDIFQTEVVPRGIKEGIVSSDYDRLEAGIIAKLIIRDITENVEFKFLETELQKEKLYAIAYKQLKM